MSTMKIILAIVAIIVLVKSENFVLDSIKEHRILKNILKIENLNLQPTDSEDFGYGINFFKLDDV